MSTSKKLERKLFFRYVLLDIIAGSGAYTALHMVRKLHVEPERFGTAVPLKFDQTFLLAAAATAALFISISALSGIYRDLTRKSRITQAFNTFGGSVITAVLLFFLVLLDDYITQYSDYYITLGVYSGSLLLLSGLFRFLLSTRVRHLIDKGSLKFPTILIGSGKEAAELLLAFQKDRSKGYSFLGYLDTANGSVHEQMNAIPCLGSTEQLADIINDNTVEDVIIALPSGNSDRIAEMVSSIERSDVRIHVLPNLFSILSGQVKMESLGRSLIEVKRELIKPHVAFIKRLFDILVASLLLLIAAPIILFSIAMIAVGSPGTIFYTQERLGKNGRTFKIIKLRSMYNDAEAQGPQLSSEEDPRITPWGRTMRKFRLDELPQFLNVLKGDMSIVGPRPERRFFFDQIIATAPQYRYLLKVKPGITSWGMVKFGYAENVEEMIERARYDLIYTENITLVNDIKILFYTLVTVLQGRGK
ncbi:sugar transferase [Schleiferiaceae bacterium]|nr:sugar transferase [Schleiferiaceae bacterium]